MRIISSLFLQLLRTSAELKQVKEEKTALCSEVQILKDKVNHLENITHTKDTTSNLDVFQEAHERMLKASNLMVYNVPL